MPINQKKINAVDVYLEKRKSREYVGRLTYDNSHYIFSYNKLYLYKERSIPLGPDLPLTKKKFASPTLFPTFLDRIPSNKNPAYKEYCKMVGISPSEKDVLVLVATLGQKGPSSFVFTPVIEQSITSEEIIKFRKNLTLTIREFAKLFDFSPDTVNKLENRSGSGKEAIKRLEIYYHFPEVALFEAQKNGIKINEKKLEYVEKLLKSKIKQAHSKFRNE